jgi:hypothetical protein
MGGYQIATKALPKLADLVVISANWFKPLRGLYRYSEMFPRQEFRRRL